MSGETDNGRGDARPSALDERLFSVLGPDDSRVALLLAEPLGGEAAATRFLLETLEGAPPEDARFSGFDLPGGGRVRVAPNAD